MKKVYTLVFFAILAFTTMQLNAQIVYTDIPDGQPAGIDFNNDNTNEFDVQTQAHQGDYLLYAGYGADNNIHALGNAGNGWDVPALVAQGFSIDASGNWVGMGDAYINGDFANPPGNSSIIVGTDQYIAARFNLGGTDIFYGWIRITVDGSGNVTYKDYAYNSTAGQPITAGDMGSPVVLVSSIMISSQGGVSSIDTKGGTLQMYAAVLPTNATDQTYTWSVVNGSGSATISNTGLLTAVSDGNVTVKATANDASATEGTMVISISNQTVGFENNENLNISCYPNPAHDMLFIENTSDLNINKLEIYSPSGKLIKEASLINNSNNRINVTDLNTGIYILKLYDNKKVIISNRIIIK